MNEKSLEYYEYFTDPVSGQIRPIDVQLYYTHDMLEFQDPTSGIIPNYFTIERGNMSIFNETLFSDTSLKRLINSLEKLELLYRLKSETVSSTELLPHFSFVVK